MKKTLSIAALAFAGLNVSAQDFAYKIPRNATAVATLKTDQLFELISVQEFNKSFAGMKLLKALSQNQVRTYTSIREFGIALNAPMYYYNRQTDSISYHCIILPLANAEQFERFVTGAKSGGRIERMDGINTLVLPSHDKSILMWNGGLAFIITGQLKKNFFLDANNKGQYGSMYPDGAASAFNYGNDADTTAMMEPAAPPPPPKTKKYHGRAVAKKSKRPQTAPVSMEEERGTEVAVQEMMYPDRRKDSLAGTWAKEYALRVFSKTEDASSILDNEAYQRSTDKNAAASIYLSSLQSMYGDLTGSYYFKQMGSFIRGGKSINAKLYLGRDEARITTDLEMTGAGADDWRRIYNHHLNPDFLKYIDGDRMIGFIGYSIDTKAYLEHFPKMMEQTYGSYMGINGDKYREELSKGADLVSLLLDEEAVAQVIKGDALFLFNGVSTRKVTYKSYEYSGDNYESKEVVKTRMETLPDFLMMVSSDDTRLIRKLLKYGVDKGQMTMQDGIYSVREGAMKFPVATHLLIKDGIIFIGTSRNDLLDIRNDSYEAHISKAQKSLLLDNNASMYFNPAMLRGKIPQKEFGSLKKWNRLNTFLGNTGVLYAKSGIEGNHFTGELVAEVPEDHENALRYFFSLIDDMASLD